MLQKSYVSLAFTAVLAVSSLTLSAVQAVAQTTGLIAHWSFDEGLGTTAGDSTGNGNLGILTNGPTWTSGQIGGALNFDGVNDYVSVGTGPSVRGLARYTVSAWVNLNSFSPAALYSESTPSSTFRLRLMVLSATSIALDGRAQDGGPLATFAQCTSGFTLAAGTWAHITGVFDSVSDVHSLYVNGAACSNNKLAVSAISNTLPNNPNRIGSQFNNVSWVNGKIDDVRIYNRALTPAEIQAVFAGNP